MKVRISFEFFDDNAVPLEGVNYQDIIDPESKNNEIRMGMHFPQIESTIENGFELYKDITMILLDIDHIVHSTTSCHSTITSYSHHFNPYHKDKVEICNKKTIETLIWNEETKLFDTIPNHGQN